MVSDVSYLMTVYNYTLLPAKVVICNQLHVSIQQLIVKDAEMIKSIRQYYIHLNKRRNTLELTHVIPRL